MATSNIAGKVVVITGPSSGIGETTARFLAGKGAKVVLGARRKDRIDALVCDIRNAGGTATGFKMDVTQRDQVGAHGGPQGRGMGSHDRRQHQGPAVWRCCGVACHAAAEASIANAIAYAIDPPAEVEIDEIVIRPTAQEF